MPLCLSSPPRSAFTLVELLAAIAIIAALLTVAGFFIASYISYSRLVADKQTLTVLNDALNRYRMQGGGTSGFTSGAPIANVLARLKQPISWSGLTHQVLQSGVTYLGRSIDAFGTGASYRFTRYNTYQSETPPSNQYPYGLGIGYSSNNNNGSGYSMSAITNSDYFTVKPSNGSPQTFASGSVADIAQCPSITYWASNASGTPAGYITSLMDNGGFNTNYNSNLVSMDVSGLTSIQSLSCESNTSLTSLTVSGLSSLQSLNCDTNQLTSLNVAGLSSLQYLLRSNNQIDSLTLSGLSSLMGLGCHYNNLTSLDVSGLASLQNLLCDGNQLTSLDLSGLSSLFEVSCNTNQLTSLTLSGLTSLTNLSCDGNLLTSLNLSGLSSLQYVLCTNNNLGTINITGHQPDELYYDPQNNGHTPTVIGP